MKASIDLGVDGLISDRPDLVRQVAAADPKTPPGFDIQGHRGGRDLRPENTLPSMEVGLDNLVTTRETDIHLTNDGVPILSHDPYIDTGKCRNADGTPYTFDDEVLIKDLTLAQIQARFICDGVIRTGTPQANDRALSPVAVAFARHAGLADAYTEPTVQQLFDFVSFYADWFSTGPGRGDPDAAARAANAAKVRYNIETKLNPRSDGDPHGIAFKDRTPDPDTIATTLARRSRTTTSPTAPTGCPGRTGARRTPTRSAPRRAAGSRAWRSVATGARCSRCSRSRSSARRRTARRSSRSTCARTATAPTAGSIPTSRAACRSATSSSTTAAATGS